MNSEEKLEALRNTFSSRGWQEVIRPAITDLITSWERHWINGTRPKGEETITDDVIKGRIWAMVWLRDWESRAAVVASRLEQESKVREKTIDFGEGGSPY